MKCKGKVTGTMVCAGVALTVVGLAAMATAERKDVTQKSSEASVVTNDNGTVSRTFTECTVSTNGTLVTEHRRETRTTLDPDGNMLASSTSEYAQSYSVGDVGLAQMKPSAGAASGKSAPAADAGSFMGLAFGDEFKSEKFDGDADEPTLLRATFEPKKKLAGFDDFYVYVTPKTHKIAKVYACAKKAIDPGASWRRHYLIEALEKRYQTWARPRSSFRPVYSFDIGGGRHVTTCLSGASRDYETVIAAWDDALLKTAADETETLRAEARKAAAEKRAVRVNDAAEAF